MRVNGFDRPFHPLQVLTWFVFPLILFGYYGILMPLLENELLYSTGLIYSMLALFTFLSAWITSAIDPRDPRVDEAQRRQQQIMASGSCLSRCCEPLAMGPAFEYVAVDESDTETIVCYLCEARVESSSKHCRFCDKCVVRFDHHCKWLNTCIGQRNYAYFLCVICCTWLFATLQLALTVYVLIRLTVPSLRASLFVRNARNHWCLPTMQAVIIALGAWAGILLPLVGLVGQLGAFHLMLLGEGLTTYEYIINEQRKEDGDDTCESSSSKHRESSPKPPGDRPNCCRETRPRERPASTPGGMLKRETMNGQQQIELTNQRAATTNNNHHRNNASKPKRTSPYKEKRDSDLAAFEEQALDIENLDDDEDDVLSNKCRPSEDDGFDSDGHQKNDDPTQDTVIHILDDTSKHDKNTTST